MDKVTLSSLIYYEDAENGWQEYQKELYKIFCRDIKDGELTFKGKIVKIRYQPIKFGKEEAFFHITCQDYNKGGERVPDFRRCERIKWIRQFIKAAEIRAKVEYNGQSYDLKIWTEQIKRELRYHILCEELRFMVVVAERDKYCLLITAFYFDHDHSLRKKLKNITTL